MTAPTRKIVDLRWQETSGVDHPANEEEGWAIMKNADVSGLGELDALIKREADMAKDMGELADKLRELKGSDPPKEIADACDTIMKWLEDQYGYGYPDKKDGDDRTVPTRVAEMIRNLWEKVTGKREGYPMKPGMKKALEAGWPEFCQKTTSIVRSAATPEQKAAQFSEAVTALRTAVEAAPEEE